MKVICHLKDYFDIFNIPEFKRQYTLNDEVLQENIQIGLKQSIIDLVQELNVSYSYVYKLIRRLEKNLQGGILGS